MKNKTNVIAEKGKQEHFIIREFDAPREIVFKAFTDPQLLIQWLHHGQTNRIDFMNYKTGGSYRFILPGPDGKGVGLFGMVHELLEPERIIKTFEYEGLPEKGHLALEKTTFEILPDNRTKVTIHYICESVGYRDGLLMSGMEKAFAGSFEIMDGLLAGNTIHA